jgi:hypothetical protein
VVGLLPPQLGGCEGKDEQNLLGGRGPSDDVNGGMEVSRPSVAMEIACCQFIALSSAEYSKIRKFARTPATAKNLVFNVKKQRMNGMDLTLQRRGRKKRCERNEGRFCGFRLPIANFYW